MKTGARVTVSLSRKTWEAVLVESPEVLDVPDDVVWIDRTFLGSRGVFCVRSANVTFLWDHGAEAWMHHVEASTKRTT